jgi:hypothetical protein
VTDATGNNTYFGPAFSGHIDYPQKHKNLKQFWERPSRRAPAPPFSPAAISPMTGREIS